MIVTGFFGIQADNEINSKLIFEDLVEELRECEKEIFKLSKYEIKKTIRNQNYDSERSNLKGFYIHFVLELPNIEIEKGTKMFTDLEKMFGIRLDIVKQA